MAPLSAGGRGRGHFGLRQRSCTCGGHAFRVPAPGRPRASTVPPRTAPAENPGSMIDAPARICLALPGNECRWMQLKIRTRSWNSDFRARGRGNIRDSGDSGCTPGGLVGTLWRRKFVGQQAGDLVGRKCRYLSVPRETSPTEYWRIFAVHHRRHLADRLARPRVPEEIPARKMSWRSVGFVGGGQTAGQMRSASAVTAELSRKMSAHRRAPRAAGRGPACRRPRRTCSSVPSTGISSGPRRIPVCAPA